MKGAGHVKPGISEVEWESGGAGSVCCGLERVRISSSFRAPVQKALDQSSDIRQQIIDYRKKNGMS